MASGGHPPISGRNGRSVSRFSTRYWDFTLLAANITGRGDIPESVALRMQITSKLTESHLGITQEAIIIRLPDATALGYSNCIALGASVTGGYFDPDVLTEAVCYFDFILNGIDYTHEPGDVEIEVVFLDQRPDRNDFKRRGEPEVFLPPLAHSRLVAEWAVAP